MNNKAHLRPKDFDSNGDIIPMSMKEEKGDLISREALLKEVRENKELFETERVYLEGLLLNAPAVDLVSPTINVNITEETKQKLIEELQKPHKLLVLPEPEVAFERPQGEWIDHSEEGYVECPICEHLTNCEDNIDELHYCWNCGAKMRGEHNE